MSTVIDAPTDAAAEEAADALTDHERAVAAAESGQTSAERGDDAGDEAGEPDSRAPTARGEIDMIAWDELVGGDLPTEEKMKFAGTSVKLMDVPEGGIKKGKHYVLILDVVASGYAVDDTHDSETHAVTATKEVRKLKVRSGRFLKDTELIVEDAELAAKAAAADEG